MELVYLWVEEYKNIRNQGFNFSPRFEFHYDKDSKKLTKVRDENTTYKSIFPDNINITAIVGENGSGKSNILNILHKGLPNYDFKGFGIFSDKKGEILYLDNLSKYPFLDKQCTKLESTLVFPLFDYSLTYDIYPDEFNKFVYPKKFINSYNNGIIDLRNELIKNQKNILLNYFHLKEKNQLSKFSNFFMPKTINIYFDISKIKTSYDSSKQTENSKKVLEKLIAIIRANMTINEFINILKKILKLLTDINSYEKTNSEFDIFAPNFMLGSSNEEQKKYNMWQSEIDLKSLSEINTIKYINSNDKWITNANFQIFSFDIDKLDYKIIEVLIASFSSEHFIIQLCDEKNKKLNNLSFGEQQLLFILNQLYSLGFYLPIFEVELPRYSNEGINEFIILLDEIEIGFHPDWQKRIISYILDFLKLLPHINFHLIFTTHSPFLLSDIPKENIVFLKQGKQVKIDIDTFGANIHTLLSNGFFMSDGLMGEFAKSKIEEIKKFYELVKKCERIITKSENVKNTIKNIYQGYEPNFRNIQNIIGEPFLKTIIGNYLDELEQIFDNDTYKNKKRDNLLKQFSPKELEEYLESLKNVKN